jgi:predicted nucleotidyltransferase
VKELRRRREETARRLDELRTRLKSASELAAGKACVYATGSFGRGEAGQFSDLDLFIVGKKNGVKGPNGREGSLLKELDAICIKADLIEVTRGLRIPEFSGDGRYLVHYSVDDFTKTLGQPEDDIENTFTARLLLLLESCALLEPDVHREVIEEVIAAYWRDYDDHKSNFMPAFLANDILRLWRTFCVNYEARTQRAPQSEKAKGKLKNYKLKHSRMLTCYSALLYLLAFYRMANTVGPKDVVAMIQLTPTGRLEWLLQQRDLSDAHGIITELLDRYNQFLKTTNVAEKELIDKFQDKNTSRTFMEAAYGFGDLVFEALASIAGQNNRFHRLLIV